MTIIKLATLERHYANNGQEAERIFRYTLTGEITTADNIAHDKGTDCLEYQIKSARATVCKGTNIEAYVATEQATKFAYVVKDFSMAYIMTAMQYIAFVKAFGTITRESQKNGGAEKIKLKSESKAMREWLARA